MDPGSESRNAQRITAHDIPDGLEVAHPTEGDKQVVQPEKVLAYREDDLPIPVERSQHENDYIMSQDNADLPDGPKDDFPKHRTVCGMRLKLLLILLAVGTVFVLGLAIGLGVGLSSKSSGKSSSDESSDPTTSTTTSASPSPTTQEEAFSIGGGLNQSYYSNKGAWNGSGLSYTWQTFSSNLEGQAKGEAKAVMYYQHHSGDIRWMRRTDTLGWLRGFENVETVAVDARNATPISAMYLIQDFASSWHIFYINKDHQISQRSASNISASWSDGAINKANLTAYDGDLAGMSVCWAGIGATLTMRLWYASSNTTFEEYLYNNEEKEWNWQSKWENLSGAAGVGCVVAPDSEDPYIYAAFVNLQSQVEIYYRTKADAHLATTGWEKSEAVIPDVYLASSVTLSGNKTVVQTTGEDNPVSIFNVTWNGRDTKASSSGAIVLGNRTPGTHLASLYMGSKIAVYSQIDGDDIVEYLEDDGDGTAAEAGAPDNILPS